MVNKGNEQRKRSCQMCYSFIGRKNQTVTLLEVFMGKIWREQIEIAYTLVAVFLITTSLMIGKGRAEDVKKISNPSSNESVMNRNIKFLVFSPSKYEFERGLVKKKEYVHNRDLSYGGKIYIALEDLKDDGSNFIFSYIDVYRWCGTIGCPFNIYQLHDRKLTSLLPSGTNEAGGFPLSITIDKAGNQDVLGILDSKTNGRHDIVLHGQTIWKWNGKDYKRE
jgi:hypothetical protein